MKELDNVEKKIAERNSTPEKEAQKERKAAEALAKKIQAKENKAKAPEKKAEKAPKKAPEKAQDKQPGKPQGDILTTKEVAAMVGTTPKALRRVLRAKWYNDGQMTHYSWTKNDPVLKEILAHYAGKAAK
jgi:spore cortex formation protein SpoVR/YcgB (stage V sporulation)